MYQDTGLLIDIETYVRRYVGLSDQAVRLSVAYVLLSWVYDAFNELPYLRFRGDYGTGKTRALFVIGSRYKCFFASGASTVSPIFPHTLDTFGGTLIFDEADFRFSDEKSELVKIFNNGNVQGFPVLRTQVTEPGIRSPRFLHLRPESSACAGPMMTGRLRVSSSLSRWSRGRSASIPINLPETQKAEALELRNKLLTYPAQKPPFGPDRPDPGRSPARAS